MQPDFSKMAQGQAKPTEEVTQEENKEAAAFVKTLPTMKKMGEAGLPTGESREEQKQRILSMLESLGLMAMFETPAKQQELAANLDALLEAMEKEDVEAITSNPIMKLIEEATSKQQPQAAAPTNFAGMVPPGGGMSGR